MRIHNCLDPTVKLLSIEEIENILQLFKIGVNFPRPNPGNYVTMLWLLTDKDHSIMQCVHFAVGLQNYMIVKASRIYKLVWIILKIWKEIVKN